MTNAPHLGRVIAAIALGSVLLTGCSGGAGLPTPKDTTVIGLTTATVSTCESLFGKAPDIARALKLDKTDSFTWRADQAQAGVTDNPLSCAAWNSPVTSAINLYVFSSEPNCSDACTRGQASNGVWALLSLKEKSDSGSSIVDGPIPDKAAAEKWLTEVAKHVK